MHYDTRTREKFYFANEGWDLWHEILSQKTWKNERKMR